MDGKENKPLDDHNARPPTECARTAPPRRPGQSIDPQFSLLASLPAERPIPRRPGQSIDPQDLDRGRGETIGQSGRDSRNGPRGLHRLFLPQNIRLISVRVGRCGPVTARFGKQTPYTPPAHLRVRLPAGRGDRPGRRGSVLTSVLASCANFVNRLRSSSVLTSVLAPSAQE